MAEPVQVAPEEATPTMVAAEPLPSFTGSAAQEQPWAYWWQRLRHLLGDDEWEALLGGNLLNKIGALVLTIGLTLFLGYSMTHLGAAGRIAVGLATSAGLLLGGVRMERKSRYHVFAHGLIGAGWAGLYATTYAAYALPAAQVIQNPVLGSALLLLVALGMIAHAVHYQAQGMATAAYGAAFAALCAVPANGFVALAVVPLAASLLYLAQRFQWHKMGVFGLVAAYSTTAFRIGADSSLAQTQTLLLVQWFLFEAFDLMRVQQRRLDRASVWLFPINAIGFIGTTFAAWSQHAPQERWLAAACIAVLYASSAVWRFYVRPPSSFREAESLPARLRAGSYEGALTLAAASAGLAIVGRVPGIWISAGLALEAELLYLLGVFLHLRFLRRLGATAFTLSVLQMFQDAGGRGQIRLLGATVHAGTPAALFHASLFGVNRALVSSAMFSSLACGLVALVLAVELPVRYIGLAWMALGLAYFELGLRRHARDFRWQAHALVAAGTIASAILHAANAPDRTGLVVTASVLLACSYLLRSQYASVSVLGGHERQAVLWGGALATSLLSVVMLEHFVPVMYRGLAWWLLAALLFEAGLRRRPAAFRACAYGVAVLASGMILTSHWDNLVKFATQPVWLSYGGAALASAAFVFRVLLFAPQDTERPEWTMVRIVASIASAAFALVTLWIVLPDPWVALGWMALALFCIYLGFLQAERFFRGLGAVLGIVAVVRLCAVNFAPQGEVFGLSYRLLTVGPMVALQYYLWHRFSGPDASEEEHHWARFYVWAAAVLAVALVDFELGRAATLAGWAGLMLAFYVTGVRRQQADLRWQGYLLAVLVLLAATALSFLAPDSISSLPRHLMAGIVTVACFYAAEFLSPRQTGDRPTGWLDWLDRYSRVGYSTVGTALLVLLLFREISGSLLTVAWGVAGLGLLSIGFPVRERALRLAGLGLLLVCIGKLFLYDLRYLDTLPRILSFVALGLILLGVSWLYTQFRERLSRLF